MACWRRPDDVHRVTSHVDRIPGNLSTIAVDVDAGMSGMGDMPV